MVFLTKSNIITISSLFTVVLAVVLNFILNLWFMRGYTRKNKVLNNKKELFDCIYSNIDDAVFIYHIIKEKVEYVSPNLERIIGVKPKLFMKYPFYLLNYAQSDSKVIIQDLFVNKTIKDKFEKEFQIDNPKSGELKWIKLKIYPVNVHNKIVQYICCISDLSKVKQSQQVLKDALLDAQKANEAKRDFLSHISHEIRTPIYSIIGMTQIASASILEQEKVVSCLNKINVSSEHLLSLINDILDMSKIESNKMLLSKERFSLRKTLDSLTQIIQSQAEYNHQNFSLILDAEDDYLIGDSMRITQILMNCISNSLKFTPPGGKISLEIKELEKHSDKALFHFKVMDNGKGMSEDYVKRIFIPFEQEDSSIASKYGGSGLGMSITKNLVTLMGGNIYVQSRQGYGTNVNIDIVFDIPKRYLLCDNQVDNKKTVPYNFSGFHILVAEDNEINMEITCEILKLTNISIDTVINGNELIKKFEASEEGYYDVILMDVYMPERNGYDTAKYIRNSNHPDAGKVCIIAMSAASFEGGCYCSIENGMNYHITKPVDPDKLSWLIHKALMSRSSFINN